MICRTFTGSQHYGNRIQQASACLLQGIPTTRAASICTSGTTVLRDPDYSGTQIHEPASVVLRMAPSFVRFGSFEICKTVDRSNTGEPGPSAGQYEIVRKLAEHVIRHHFPAAASCSTSADRLDSASYLAFYQAIVESTARLLAEWQCIGFCHGVMNTDNMSVLGLTLGVGVSKFSVHYPVSILLISMADAFASRTHGCPTFYQNVLCI